MGVGNEMGVAMDLLINFLPACLPGSGRAARKETRTRVQYTTAGNEIGDEIPVWIVLGNVGGPIVVPSADLIAETDFFFFQ